MKQSGELVGPYRIIRPIGKGGFGYVHLAENVETGQQVALKIVYADPNDPSGEDLRLEEQGALLQQKLAIDTRIVPVFDIGHHQCDLYIAMEFVDGPTLERQIEEGMPPERAWPESSSREPPPDRCRRVRFAAVWCTVWC